MRKPTETAVLIGRWCPMAKLSTLLLAAALILGFACGGDSDGDSAATLADPVATGTQLVTKYISLLQDKDIDGLDAFISDAFIIQRADGSNDEKAAYLQNIPQIGEYTITDVTALQADDALIVRWFLTVNETINGQT